MPELSKFISEEAKILILVAVMLANHAIIPILFLGLNHLSHRLSRGFFPGSQRLNRSKRVRIVVFSVEYDSVETEPSSRPATLANDFVSRDKRTLDGMRAGVDHLVIDPTTKPQQRPGRKSAEKHPRSRISRSEAA
jgi:hypothetical protein